MAELEVTEEIMLEDEDFTELTIEELTTLELLLDELLEATELEVRGPSQTVPLTIGTSAGLLFFVP